MKGCAADLLIEQLRHSRIFPILLLALPITYLISLPIQVPAYFIILYAMIATVTAVHEAIHIRATIELGYPIGEIRVLRVGDIRYELNAPGEIRRIVAVAPYFSLHQYLIEVMFIGFLTFIALSAPYPYSLALSIFNALPVLHLISLLCSTIAFKRGSCLGLARLASRGDLEEGYR